MGIALYRLTVGSLPTILPLYINDLREFPPLVAVLLHRKEAIGARTGPPPHRKEPHATRATVATYQQSQKSCRFLLQYLNGLVLWGCENEIGSSVRGGSESGWKQYDPL